MLLVSIHHIRRNLHVCEHALQFLREVEATFNLELGKHSSFGIIGDGSIVQKTLCKMGFVVSLKRILFSDETEYRDGFVECIINFLITFLYFRFNDYIKYNNEMTNPFEPFLQVLVYVQRYELWCTRVTVDQ